MKFTPVLTLASICLSAAIATPLSRFEAKVAKGLRFVQTSADSEPFWVSEGYKHELLRTNKGLLDLTDTYHEMEEQTGQQVMSGVERAAYPPPSQETTVKSIISTLSIPRMEATLSNLTLFNNRYYQSDTGVAASTWIYNQLVSIAGRRKDITIAQITHAWAQKSIVAKLNGASATSPVVILGSHLDSINQDSPMSGRAPGADDDGTGTTNLIEVFRALVAANFTPARSVEFHFYAAEEVGLLGSKDIATNYRNGGVPVYAMVNFDMTAYFKPGSKEVIALVTDRIDSGLNSYLESLISTYCSLPAGSDYCGYACSDHASWNKQGYPAAFAVEAPTEFENPKSHTPEDTTSVEGFSWSHTLEFAKLAVAVAVELGSV